MGLAANCTCAVVAGKCEAGAGCCCDPDCEGVAGGGAALNTTQLQCAEGGGEPGLCSSGGHPLLCVQLSNTAYLGHYHAPASRGKKKPNMWISTYLNNIYFVYMDKISTSHPPSLVFLYRRLRFMTILSI